MTGPFIATREALPLDLLEQGAAGDGWGGLEALEQFKAPIQELTPGDDTALFMFLLSRDPQGRKVFEWMMDISIRQPYRPTGATIEQTALAAAVRQGVNGFAEVILKAIAKGGEIAQTKNQNGAGS